MDPDALTRLEALVRLGIVGENRHLPPGHQVEDGSGDRHLGFFPRQLPGTEALELGITLAVEKNAPVTRTRAAMAS